MTQGEEAEETAKFAEMFDKFFDCLNVSYAKAGMRSKNCFKNPYRKPNDFRLKVCCTSKICKGCSTVVLLCSG